jgi:hypothetical protein
MGWDKFWDLGVAVAAKVWDAVTRREDHDSHDRASQRDSAADMRSDLEEHRAQVSSELRRAIKELSSKVDAIGASTANKVIDKIEQEQFEKLIAQIKSINLALEFKDKGMLTGTLVHLNEQVEYAWHRLAEGKQNWIPQWFFAMNLKLAALHQLAETDEQQAIVNSAASDFRKQFLDVHRHKLYEQAVDWQHIADFVNGQSHDLFAMIAPPKASPSPTAAQASQEKQDSNPKPEKKPKVRRFNPAFGAIRF